MKPTLSNEYRELNLGTGNDKEAWHSKIADELESTATCNNMREFTEKEYLNWKIIQEGLTDT